MQNIRGQQNRTRTEPEREPNAQTLGRLVVTEPRSVDKRNRNQNRNIRINAQTGRRQIISCDQVTERRAVTTSLWWSVLGTEQYFKQTNLLVIEHVAVTGRRAVFTWNNQQQKLFNHKRNYTTLHYGRGIDQKGN